MPRKRKQDDPLDKSYRTAAVGWVGEQLPGGFFIYRADETAEILYANSALLRLFGCDTMEAFKAYTGNTFRGMVHPVDYETVSRSIGEQIAADSESGSAYVEFRIIRRDDSVRWVDDYSHFTRFPEYGDVFYAFIGDITEKHLEQEENYRRSNVYTALMEQSRNLSDKVLAMIRLNLTKGVVEDARGVDLFDADRVGGSIAACATARCESFLIEGDREQFLECFSTDTLAERFYMGQPPARMVAYCRRQSGKQCFVRFTRSVALHPESGDLILFGAETEYNDQKAAEVLNEKVLAQQYDMVSYIIDNNYNVIIGDAAKIGKGSIFPRENDGVYTDYIRDCVLPAAAKGIHDVSVLREALSPEQIAAHLDQSESYTVNVTCDIDGEIFYKRFTFYSVDKEMKFFLMLKSDLTEMMRYEHKQNDILANALQEAKHANTAKTAFLSGMSHEIRTPMNAIIGLNSIALKDPSLSDRTRTYLNKIGESAGHLLSLINDILDMSRIESGRLVLRKEIFSMGEVLDQVNTMIGAQCRDKGLLFEYETVGEVDDWFLGDDTKIRQVLINILGNAVKFTDVPGTVSFTVEKIAHYDQQSTLRFTIRDNGIGMDEAFVPHIFDAFSQEDASRSSKYGSTGLGMAITKNIVELMNGAITVSSVKGIGSVFTVTLTLKKCMQPAKDLRLFDPTALKVLAVDDDEVALEHAVLALEDIGVYADTASSGASALQSLEIQHAKKEPYSLVIIDAEIPPCDGVDAIREIHRRYHSETGIIMLAAYPRENAMAEALEAGADGCIIRSEFDRQAKHEIKRVMKQLKKTAHRSVSLEGRRILLAEDMPINAEIMKELLAIRQMQVDHAENGKEALEMFERSMPYTYDAILMDVRMPLMDGLDAASAIRRLDREDAAAVPIIALTANAFDEDVQHSLQAGMNAHLSKPVEPELLYRTIEDLIRCTASP